MSNAIRLEAGKIGFRPDAATARRQFWLSLGAGLAVLAVAAMIDWRPGGAAPGVASARRGQVSAPEFVAFPAAVAALRRSAAVGSPGSAD
jgi:hypothetical protein